MTELSRYVIVPSLAWDRRAPLHEVPGAEIVAPANLDKVVEARAGRNPLAIPSVRTKLSRTGRVFIAGAKGHESILIGLVPASVPNVTHDPTSRG